LKGPDGAEVVVPQGSLIYIRDLDESSPGHADGAKPVPSRYAGGLPLGTYADTDAQAPTGPDQYEIEVAMDEDRPQKFATGGNLWVEGVVAGTVTVYADASVIVTGDLLTSDNTTDLIGLLAGGSVELYNPMIRTYVATEYPPGSGGYTWTVPQSTTLASGWPHDYEGYVDNPSAIDPKNPKADSKGPKVLRIEAAMIAGRGSFLLQNWKSGGPLGQLQVYGSIAQNFRGVVAQESDDTMPQLINGYTKQFKYNENLIEEQPLLFSPIGNGDWRILWQEKVQPSDDVKKAAQE
jgi:hypothetical protein